ncbi:SUN domain-containing protein 3-like isoform X2 [Gambusia affinis]|uniref:SUN domain-containing protein 3-like isoform X2 n=1 Tax=Gambusia affinis TaxID=33528 RepID=UPI001CDD8F05|nr:SUN domain-containing protein 3-like isoform X2 [Gambusia affinis]
MMNRYYSSNGELAISYRETRVRGRQRKSPLNRKITDNHKDNDEDFIVKEEIAPLICRGIIFVILLVSGCSCLFSALHFQSSEPVKLTPVDIDQEKLPEDYNEDVQDMKKKIDYLLPPADLWPNFALESQGARLVHTMTSETYQRNRPCRLFGITSQQQQQSIGPNIVIQGRNHLNPGECWAFTGFPGRLSIQLSHRATVTHVSLGHITKIISPSFTVFSAPREFSVYGKKDINDEESFLGTFQYEEDGDRLQTFKLPDDKTDSFTYVSLEVNSNWGQLDYTCLYNFRVHGVIAP